MPKSQHLQGFSALCCLFPLDGADGYALAFCVVTCVVNSVNCVWVEVVSRLLPAQLQWLHSIGTTVLNGGISMVIFFAVNKTVFQSPD